MWHGFRGGESIAEQMAGYNPNQTSKPTTLRRTSGQATTLRHGAKPEKTSCTAETRRRGDEFNFDEKFAQKTRKFGISTTETRSKPTSKSRTHSRPKLIRSLDRKSTRLNS